jgi:5-methylcytosine-specific restriction endonuclease McrA
MAGLSKEYGYWTDKQKADYQADYYRLNREKMKAKAKAHYHATANLSAARYQAKRSAVLEKQRMDRAGERGAAMQEGARNRYKRNPAPAIARANKRRAIRLKAAHGTDRAAYRTYVKGVREAATATCHWCHKDVPKGDRRIDHIVPLAKGGSDAVENLCCACRLCNARKSDQMPDAWRRTISACQPEPSI